MAAPPVTRDELTIDELARESGMTARNIRAHQSRGLLPPPTVRSRTGFYGPAHLTRIRLIQEMQAQGFNLKAIERLLELGAGGGSEGALEFERALLQPFGSEQAELLDEEELRTVLGHEAGHILAEHVMYRTALLILLNLSQSGPLGLVAGLPLVAVRLALLEWFRAAELSCDRAATLVNRDPMTTCRTLMVLGSGMRSEQLNVDTFVRQGSEYRDMQGWDKLARMRGELFRTHPHSVKRVHELMKWVQSGEYDRIVAGDYIRRGSEPGAREEADAATQHYAERFRGFFTDATDGVAKVGEQLTDATNKVTDWLRRDRENQ